MRLVTPQEITKEAWLDYVAEWEAAGEEMVPYSARAEQPGFEEWLRYSIRIETEAPSGFVTAHTWFLAEEDGTLLGAVNLRHSLNEYLASRGGHIGYGVRPTRRRQGLATKMLAATLPLAKQLGLERVLVTCDRDNPASAKTILACGGVLEGEIEHEGCVVQRYWIAL